MQLQLTFAQLASSFAVFAYWYRVMTKSWIWDETPFSSRMVVLFAFACHNFCLALSDEQTSRLDTFWNKYLVGNSLYFRMKGWMFDRGLFTFIKHGRSELLSSFDSKSNRRLSLISTQLIAYTAPRPSCFANISSIIFEAIPSFCACTSIQGQEKYQTTIIYQIITPLSTE